MSTRRLSTCKEVINHVDLSAVDLTLSLPALGVMGRTKNHVDLIVKLNVDQATLNHNPVLSIVDVVGLPTVSLISVLMEDFVYLPMVDLVGRADLNLIDQLTMDLAVS